MELFRLDLFLACSFVALLYDSMLDNAHRIQLDQIQVLHTFHLLFQMFRFAFLVQKRQQLEQIKRLFDEVKTKLPLLYKH